MLLQFVNKFGSIAGLVSTEELSDFMILTGENGAGKSNLLESLVNGSNRIVGMDPNNPPQRIRYFQLAQLVAQVEGPQSPMNYRDRHIQLQQQIQGLRFQFEQPGNALTRDQVEQNLRASVVGSRMISQIALNRLVEESGKDLLDLETSDFKTYAPLITGIRDPFGLSVAELFLSYHIRKLRNSFEQWLVAEHGATDIEPVSDEEFERLYGPAPWELLDSTLSLIGLNYRFVAPQGTEETAPYEAELVHRTTGDRIKATQLSTGEKTLLAIALSLYSGSRLGEAIELPLVLLLDEADASLHPSMIRSLVQVAHDVFYKQYGVKVIMTTHSPTTVALAPEESLYVMRRDRAPRLVPATRDEALASLTVGLPTLSVSVEGRRQVFVESEYDETVYQLLYQLCRPLLNSPFSLIFIASGRGGQGDSEAVKHLVSTLRAAGNASVWGILDRDMRAGAGEGIIFDADRYAVENLILDPLAVGVYLLRTGSVRPHEFGLPSELRHYEMGSEHAQVLSDAVVARVLTSDERAAVELVTYEGGPHGEFQVSRPELWSQMRGHDLERRLTDTFLSLRGAGKHLKQRVVEEALGDVPRFLPTAARRLFEQLLVG